MARCAREADFDAGAGHGGRAVWHHHGADGEAGQVVDGERHRYIQTGELRILQQCLGALAGLLRGLEHGNDAPRRRPLLERNHGPRQNRHVAIVAAGMVVSLGRVLDAAGLLQRQAIQFGAQQQHRARADLGHQPGARQFPRPELDATRV
jgi:hypothetical protein